MNKIMLPLEASMMPRRAIQLKQIKALKYVAALV